MAKEAGLLSALLLRLLFFARTKPVIWNICRSSREAATAFRKKAENCGYEAARHQRDPTQTPLMSQEVCFRMWLHACWASVGVMSRESPSVSSIKADASVRSAVLSHPHFPRYSQVSHSVHFSGSVVKAALSVGSVPIGRTSEMGSSFFCLTNHW